MIAIFIFTRSIFAGVGALSVESEFVIFTDEDGFAVCITAERTFDACMTAGSVFAAKFACFGTIFLTAVADFEDSVLACPGVGCCTSGAAVFFAAFSTRCCNPLGFVVCFGAGFERFAILAASLAALDTGNAVVAFATVDTAFGFASFVRTIGVYKDTILFFAGIWAMNIIAAPAGAFDAFKRAFFHLEYAAIAVIARFAFT